MHWRDIDDDTWEGLTVTLTRDELPAHPRWNTDVVRPGRVRITAGDAARWWGRQARDLACVSLLRGAPMTHDDAVVRPITRDDLSAVTAPPGTIAWWRSWSLWFLDAMVASGRSRRSTRSARAPSTTARGRRACVSAAPSRAVCASGTWRCPAVSPSSATPNAARTSSDSARGRQR